ncbi:MAG: RICIN domain-containing protein [Clostridiales bacterium]|nr:RICIN domain-containing protein [Clostridiales bacterium]
MNQGHTTNETRCATFPWSDYDYKLWQLKIADNGDYELRPMHAIDKSLTVESENENVNVIIYDRSSTKSNKWKIIPNDSNYTSYRLMSNESDYQFALGVTTQRWCKQMSYSSSTTAAKWEIEYVKPLQVPGLEEGVNRIKNVRSGYYLDVPNSATADGTQIKQYAFNGNNTMTSNQLWRVKYHWDGTYTLSPMHCQEKGLRVTGGLNDALVQLYPTDSIPMSGTSVYWQIINNDDSYGSYRIASEASNFTKVLAIENASTLQGANAIEYTFGSANNDRWIFIKIPTP